MEKENIYRRLAKIIVRANHRPSIFSLKVVLKTKNEGKKKKKGYASNTLCFTVISFPKGEEELHLQIFTHWKDRVLNLWQTEGTATIDEEWWYEHARLLIDKIASSFVQFDWENPAHISEGVRG